MKIRRHTAEKNSHLFVRTVTDDQVLAAVREKKEK